MRPVHRLVALLAILAAPCAAQGGPAAVVKSDYPSEDVIIAVQTLKAPPSGADAAPAIQQAIDKVAAAGGGTLFLAEGRYRLAAPLTLKEGVVLRGEKPFAGSDAKGNWVAFDGRGTVLMPVSGRGSADGPAAITMERGTGVTDLSIWYPEQRAEDIQPYPWTIQGSAKVSGDNYTVRNVLFVNPYQAMRFGPEWNELHTIQDVCGTPLKTGIFVDTCTDIGRLTNVDFSATYWQAANLLGAPSGGTAKAALRAALLQDAVGVDMLRSDWEYQYRVRVAGYGIGFRYRPGAQGTTNGVMYDCKALGCRVGLEIVEMNGVGLAATNCYFDGTEAGVVTRPSYTAVAQLNDCRVWSDSGAGMRLEGRGTVTACRTQFESPCPMLDAASGRVTALGCLFVPRSPGAGAPDIRLGPGVKVARILACAQSRAGGAPARVSHADGSDIVVDGRPLELTTPRAHPGNPVPLARPKSSALVLASECGVSPSAADNTRALQTALDKAGKLGGTVYLAAGRYKIAGSLVVPGGVEFRGSFDVPHHTQSAGSVLLATGGRGQEQGTALIRLKPGSGVRGLTVWYPEQNIAEPVPYPWTVQSLGPNCWATDVTIGNGWQGFDFYTHPSTGHRIRYPGGGLFRRGVFVSKSDRGVVEDVQFNPHYMARIPADLPHPTYQGDPFGRVIAYQQANLEGLVFGSCKNEQILRTFLYSALDGLKFANDGGGTSGVVVNHGTDAGSRAVTFEALSPDGLDLYNTQLVVLGTSQVGAVVTLPAFTGGARLFNSQIWAPGTMAVLDGPGKVVLQQFNNLTGPVRASAAKVLLHAGCFQGAWQPAVTLGGGPTDSQVIACLQPKGFIVAGAASDTLQTGNSPLPKVRPGPTTFGSTLAPGQPRPDVDALQEQGGGQRAVSGLQCRVAEGAGHDGAAAIRYAGNADNPDHSYSYCRLFTTKVIVHPDTVLSYWMKPSNALSRKTALDLLFDDGGTLRDSGAADTTGRGAHPGTDRGTVGQWEHIVVPLGHKAGDAVTTIMAAFDGRPGGGPFETLFSDIRLYRQSEAK